MLLFFFLVSKSLLVFLIISGFFPFTFVLMNQSSHFLLIGLTFSISIYSHLSISSLNTIIDWWSSSFIFLLIFSFLSFNSLFIYSIKSFSNSKTIFYPEKLVIWHISEVFSLNIFVVIVLVFRLIYSQKLTKKFMKAK